MIYRREIDGLRALAVMPVIFFHAGFRAFGGGFIGVDVFFVISGYLITSIIVDELRQKSFSLATFYERRARRILPALCLVMLSSVPLAWVWMMPSDLKDFSQSIVAVCLFVSNILFWRESGYFETAFELKPLAHTWSLAVEEQFYLLFPLVLLAAWRRGGRWVVNGFIFVAILSLIFSQWAISAVPRSAFYLLPSRVWELIIGGLAALYLAGKASKSPSRFICEAAGWIGVALIVFSATAFSEETPFPGVYALIPTIGTVLIILFASQDNLVGRVMGNKVFVNVGLVSYSAYLWHQPLFAFLRLRYPQPDETMFTALILVSLGLAYLTWRYVETHFRDRNRSSRKQCLVAVGVSGGFLLAAGLLGSVASGGTLNSLRFTDSQLATIRSASFSPKRTSCHFPQERAFVDKAGCRYFGEHIEVAVVGNSHGVELAFALAELLEDRDIGVSHNTMSGCQPSYKVRFETESICGMWHQRVFEKVAADSSIKVVVLSYRNERTEERYLQSLAALANDFVGAGKNVIVVLQAPLLVAHVNTHLTQSLPILSGSIKSRALADWMSMYEDSRRLLSLLRPEVRVVDPKDWLCDRDFCYAVKDGEALYFDDNHLSVAGALVVGRQLLLLDNVLYLHRVRRAVEMSNRAETRN